MLQYCEHKPTEVDELVGARLGYLSEAPGHALEAKKFLIKIGRVPVMNSYLKRLMKNMRVKMKPIPTDQKTVLQAQRQQLLDLIKELQK